MDGEVGQRSQGSFEWVGRWTLPSELSGRSSQWPNTTPSAPVLGSLTSSQLLL